MEMLRIGRAMQNSCLMSLSWGDMYNYLVNSPGEYTQDNLKALKITGSFQIFCLQPSSMHLL